MEKFFNSRSKSSSTKSLGDINDIDLDNDHYEEQAMASHTYKEKFGERAGIDIHQGNTDTTGIKNELSPIHSKNWQRTQSDGLGEIILQMGSMMNELASKSKSNKIIPFDLETLSGLFAKKLDNEVQILEDTVKLSTKRVQSNLLDQSLNSHLNNPRVCPPTRYGEVATLTSSTKIRDCMLLLPRKKYDNAEENGSILEFLEKIKLAQSRLLLTRNELTEMILYSTTGSAHKCVQGLVENGEDIDTIFHQLVVLYDNSLTPEQGRIKLHSFKATREDNLDKIIAEILELATISSKLYPIGSVRSNHVNVTASMALIQSLPDQGVRSVRRLASQTYTKLCSQVQTGSQPTYSEFQRALSLYKEEINAGIKAYAPSSHKSVSKDFVSNRDREFGAKPKYNRPYGKSLAVHAVHAEVQGTNFSNSKKTWGPPKYCSLCGSHGSHNASDLCYKMKDANNKPIMIVPAQKACNICLKAKGVSLFHPEKYCFHEKDNGVVMSKTSKSSGNQRSRHHN